MLDFRGLVKLLEQRGELLRIARAVDPRFEMPALMEQVEAKHRAFLFEHVRGSSLPVVGGILNRIECYGWALGSRPGDAFTADDLHSRLEVARARGAPPREVQRAPVKEVRHTGQAINLGALPAPTAFERDSGPFITGAVGLVRNPETGTLNAGVYRTPVLGPTSIAVNASGHSDLQRAYRHAEKRGLSMPIALAIGVEPALLMAAVYKLGPEESELDLAGALQSKPIELIRCETSDLLVPANAEMIIEGRVDFSRRTDNTLGEFVGQYGPGNAPISEVTAITQRRDAMFYAILAGRNPEHNTLGSIATLSMKRTLGEMLRRNHPRIRDFHIYLEPSLGTMAHLVVSIAKESDGEPMELIDALFKDRMGPIPVSLVVKRIVVVDDDVNVQDMRDVEWAMWTRVARAGKFRVIPNVQSWELERAAKTSGSLRLAVDATSDLEDRQKLLRTRIPGAESIRLADYLGDRRGDVS